MHVSLLPCFLSQERPKHEKFVLFGSFRCILLQIIAFSILLFAALQVKLTNFQTQLVECKLKSAKSENTGNPKTAPRGTNGPSLPTNFAHAALLSTPVSANSDTPFFLANSDIFSPANSDTIFFFQTLIQLSLQGWRDSGNPKLYGKSCWQLFLAGWQDLAGFRRGQKWPLNLSSSAYLQFSRQMHRFCA